MPSHSGPIAISNEGRFGSHSVFGDDLKADIRDAIQSADIQCRLVDKAAALVNDATSKTPTAMLSIRGKARSLNLNHGFSRPTWIWPNKLLAKMHFHVHDHDDVSTRLGVDCRLEILRCSLVS